MTRTSVRVLISGKVQRVGYRAWTRKTAKRSGLDGWVRNLPDGRVEALFSGDSDMVTRMIRECREGPPLARVTGIEKEPADPPTTPGFSD